MAGTCLRRHRAILQMAGRMEKRIARNHQGMSAHAEYSLTIGAGGDSTSGGARHARSGGSSDAIQRNPSLFASVGGGPPGYPAMDGL